MSECKMRPRGAWTILSEAKREEKTVNGIIIPDSAQQESDQGTVLAVGPGRLQGTAKEGNMDGARIPIDVKVGDVVLYAKQGVNRVKVAGTEYLVVHEDAILSIIDT